MLVCVIGLTVFTAAPATAEISSVDAYGGQAQVLGKPVHHHHVATNGSTEARGSGRENTPGAGASGSSKLDGSSGSSTGSTSGSGANTGSSSGTLATPSGSRGVGSGSGGGGAGAGAGSDGAHGGSVVAHGQTGSHGASAAGQRSGQSPPIAAANLSDNVSDGSLSLSALDVLLLVVLFAGLLGVGVLIRRLSRQSE